MGSKNTSSQKNSSPPKKPCIELFLKMDYTSGSKLYANMYSNENSQIFAFFGYLQLFLQFNTLQ